MNQELWGKVSAFHQNEMQKMNESLVGMEKRVDARFGMLEAKMVDIVQKTNLNFQGANQMSRQLIGDVSVLKNMFSADFHQKRPKLRI